ncbi:hypothetical protein ABZT07_20335 [Streptomyces sp. NPDC005317]|uniref:hypothetical protein n=1 Tax=Streptomyces sp. NPDC005317 TaxID=3156876 RepID=UPI0033A8A2EB
MANPSEHLIQLCRAAVDAEQQATSQPYSKEGWAPWLDASAAFQAAVTDEAAASGEDRGKLEMATKKAVLHPEPTVE